MAHHHYHPLRIPPNPNHDVVPSPRPSPTPSAAADLASPFGHLDGLAREDFREAAYEVFFTACRSSPGFGGRSAINYYNNSASDSDADGPKSPGVGMAVTSRVKRALGLKMIRRPPPSSRRHSSYGGGSNSPMSPSGGSPFSPRAGMMTVPGAVRRRPLTSAEIMRQQMKVSEQSDNRLRKTLMRTLVGQMGRRAETIILPLELLRHLKPSEFNDTVEYHIWQKRQLGILETGLLLHPSIPLEKSDPSAAKLREIIRSCEAKPIDTGKNSDSMRALCNSVVSLAWRSPVDNGTTDVCHWADGYPLNAEIYVSLLSSVFDSRDESQVLDEVDELLELMKKTWSMLGINRSVHNLCFAWVLFAQYVSTGQVEPDLLGAASSMLCEVSNDAKKPDREPMYVKMLGCVLTAIKRWCEKRLLDYHANFDKGSVGVMEHVLPLVFSCAKILQDDVPSYAASPHTNVGGGDDLSGNRVDYYIRGSLRNAFAKMVEDQKVVKGAESDEMRSVSEVLIKLARETEELASKEKDIFSPVMRKWHPAAAGVAAVTLHLCYGNLLKQYLTGISSSLMNEMISVLQRAGKLEKVLVQMVVEDSEECEDGGKSVVREMMPYEVDTLILNLLKQWIQGRLMKGKEFLHRAKETETWNPKSKTEPYALSASEIVKFAKEAVESFFEIPVNVSENLVYDLTDGLEHIFGDYITFVASCGSKQSYLPTLPPLTRCGRDSKFFKLWKRAACSTGAIDHQFFVSSAGTGTDPKLPRASTSRGTQRLYIRLNTLHYLLSQLHTLDKILSLSPKITPPKSRFGNRRQLGSSYFEQSRSSIRSALQHVSEVAAYRLVFLDSNAVFYGSLYVADVSTSRIKPTTLKTLRQNFTLLRAIVTERVQPLALKELIKACFEAYLMVLLAGGCSRIFSRSDHAMIEEDFGELRRVVGACVDGLIGEDEVERESEAVEGVVALIGESTEQLVEDFSIMACEASGIGIGGGVGKKIPMPPTTGRWNRSDPNTILRVLCHRDDAAANHFLKRTFHLPKRSGSA